MREVFILETKRTGTKKKRERIASVLFGNTRENHKATQVETKRWAQNMKNPCKACAEISCMGTCADWVKYREEYLKVCDRIRQQIKQQRRGERGQEHTDPVL